MKKNNEYFIKVLNSLVTVGNENKLSINELFIYSYLYTIRTFEDVIKTNYELISAENQLYKDKTKNKKEVIDCIQALIQKNIITVNEKKDVLTITFSNKVIEETSFVQIYYKEFRLITNPRDFYIYVAVKKWGKGAKYAYSTWADLLDVSKTQAKRIIKDVVDREIIYKQEGSYNNSKVEGRNQKNQDFNTYSIKPFNNGIIIKDANVDENTKENISSSSDKESSNHEDKNPQHKWYEREYPDVDDYVFYLTTNDEKLKKHAEKRMKLLSKSEYGKQKVGENLSDAKRIIEEKENKKLTKSAKAIIDKTNDVALLINGKLIAYADYNNIDKVDTIYFIQSTFENSIDAYVDEVTYKNNPKNIEVYRQVDGQWREDFNINNDEKNFNDENKNIEISTKNLADKHIKDLEESGLFESNYKKPSKRKNDILDYIDEEDDLFPTKVNPFK